MLDARGFGRDDKDRNHVHRTAGTPAPLLPHMAVWKCSSNPARLRTCPGTPLTFGKAREWLQDQRDIVLIETAPAPVSCNVVESTEDVQDEHRNLDLHDAIMLLTSPLLHAKFLRQGARELA